MLGVGPLCPRLYLLGAPAGVGLSHVRGGLDAGDKFEYSVADANKANDGAGDYAQDVAVEQDGADKDVEGAAADEAEEEGGVARDLGRDLELEEAGGFCGGQSPLVKVRVCENGQGGRMLTEAEDHDIASNDDGLAIAGKSASTPARSRCLKGKTQRPAQEPARPARAVARERRARWVGEWPRAGGCQRSARQMGDVQAEREELRDAAEDHDDGNHQVDDATKIRVDMLAFGVASDGATRDRLVGFCWGSFWVELRAPVQTALSFFSPQLPRADQGRVQLTSCLRSPSWAGAGCSINE